MNLLLSESLCVHDRDATSARLGRVAKRKFGRELRLAADKAEEGTANRSRATHAPSLSSSSAFNACALPPAQSPFVPLRPHLHAYTSDVVTSLCSTSFRYLPRPQQRSEDLDAASSPPLFDLHLASTQKTRSLLPYINRNASHNKYEPPSHNADDQEEHWR